MPHTAARVRSMDFPNAVHILAAVVAIVRVLC